MENDPEEARRKEYILRRSIMDCGMGVIIFGCGIFFLIGQRFGYSYSIDPLFRYMFAGLCLLYGVFRFYRGIKKSYFN